MENLKTEQVHLDIQVITPLTAERIIHGAIFILLLIGLTVLSLWLILRFLPLQDNLVLDIAIIPLGWGLILPSMYVCFNRLGWKWWS